MAFVIDGPSGTRRVGGKGRSFASTSRSTSDAATRLSNLQNKVLPNTQRTSNTGFRAPEPAPVAAPSSRGTYTPATPRATTNLPQAASEQTTTTWVDELKKATKPQGKGPKLPAQVNLNQYRTELATIEDIAKKYGFDFSREYAQRQAEVLAQAQRDEIETSRERQQWETERAQQELEHDYFQEYLQQRQALADTGLNAGIAAERDLRLEMNRQYALADILANSQLYNQELDRRLATIAAEEQAYAERLYNERLQQGFANALDYSRFIQSENQWLAQMAMQQRAQAVEEAWREYEFNNMSAAERAKLLADAEKFGMEMAWERYKFDAGLAFEAGYAGGGTGFTSGSGGGWRTSKGEPPQSFKNHLSQALQITGFPSSWIPAVSELIARESTWNPNAKNPKSTAHGYGQFLNSTRRDYEKRYGISYTNPVNQLVLTLYYIRDRYGNPQKALAFHNKNNWY